MKVGSHPFRIIPGDRGKIGPGWLVRSLLKRGRKPREKEAGFTGSTDGRSRAFRNAKMEPSDKPR